MNEIVFIVEEAPAGGYTARSLGDSIFTEADTCEEWKEAAQEAVRTHFDEGQQPHKKVKIIVPPQNIKRYV